MTATASVIIPAHNEASVIARSLGELAEGARTGELEVIVACNGCTDSTASIARDFENVTVLEVTEASKVAALRAGDRVATALPRIYLDADVIVSLDAIRATVACLATDGVRAARPPINYVSDRSSWLVREYYAARSRLPSVLNSLWGAGVYALNRGARARFDEFPDVVADDLWVDGLFDRSEVVVVDCNAVAVHVPRRSADLLGILRRAQKGKTGIAGNTGAPGQQQMTASVARELRELARTGGRGAISAVVYGGFAVASRMRRTGKTTTDWERDESSRQS